MSENVHSGERVGLASADSPIVSTESHGIATASDTANNVTVGLVNGGESLPLVLREILDEMRELTQTLKTSRRPCNCHGPETAGRSVRAVGMDVDQQQNPQRPEHEASENQDAGEGREARDVCEREDVSEVDSDRLKFQLEVRLLREPDEDVKHTHKAKHTFLEWLLATPGHLLIWLNPDFLAEFKSGPSEQTRGLFDAAWDKSHSEIVRNSPGRFTRKWAPFHALDASQSAIEESALYRQTWACPPGRISWVTDGLNSPLYQGMRDDQKTRVFSAVTTLVQCFLIPDAEHELHQAFYTFTATFSDFFRVNHPATVRSWAHIFIDSKNREEESFALQYHLRSFSPLSVRDRKALALGLPLRDLFIRKRQIIWIGPDAESTGTVEGITAGYFAERALSISLIMYEPRGAFQIVVLRDVPSHTQGHDVLGVPKGLQRVPGLWHFLNALEHLLESWHRDWSSTLAVIDKVVGFTMDHTKDDHGLDKFMFDDAGFMKLSKRYFTVLQILRIARQWIDENYTEWDKFCKDVDRYLCLWLRRISGGDDEVLASWDEQRDNVTQLLKTQTQELRDRIDRKSEEVKSLRDGLFSATSLREATKGMDINRAIYVFTAVTVIYTPLGFVSALWALPILNTTAQGENTHPSLPTFVATFILVPVLTYLICGGLAWYYTSRNSKRLVQDASKLARDRFRNMFSREEAKGWPN